MRHLVVFVAALLAIGCGAAGVEDGNGVEMQPEPSAGANTPDADTTEVMDFLLASAAADFHAHPPAKALRFHNVRLGHTLKPDGSRHHMLCGEVESDQGNGEAERIAFVTIDSPGGPNGYQQMLGGNEVCNDPSATFEGAGDLSSSLQSRFDAL